MNANELAEELGVTLEELCESQRETIRNFREVIRKQDARIKVLNSNPVKELTDEEIDKLIYEHITGKTRLEEFARAILRKASEK